MYFVFFFIAFAILLSAGLPPDGWDVLAWLVQWCGGENGTVRTATIGLVVLQPLVTLLVVGLASRRAELALDGTPEGEDRFEDRWHRIGTLSQGLLLGQILICLLATGWIALVREGWNLERFPLVAEAVILAPIFASAAALWWMLYPVEIRWRRMLLEDLDAESRAERGDRAQTPHTHSTSHDLSSNAAESGAVNDAEHLTVTRMEYLVYKLRHHLLTIVVPMSFIVAARYFAGLYKDQLLRMTQIPWIVDGVAGVIAGGVLLLSPLMFRHIWATRPLPDGPLRNRLESLCRRVGMRYRDILIWESHGVIVNAAVMGIFAPVRFVLLSDVVLSRLSPQQIEGVFAHEAGHVRRHHLLFYGIFAIFSLLLVGGVLEVLMRGGFVRDPQTVQLIGMIGMITVWGMLFGFISRKFERQADLFAAMHAGLKDVAIPAGSGFAMDSGAHGSVPLMSSAANSSATHSIELSGAGVAVAVPKSAVTPNAGTGAVSSRDSSDEFAKGAWLFGQTLREVARYAGIPLEGWDWLHGSIQSRCDLLVDFVHERDKVRAFERQILWIKTLLLLLTLIGIAIGAWLYWPRQLVPPQIQSS